jgi:DNA repair protein RecN (Recombination protein N)
MLTEIHIENFAIIERLDVNFASGLVTLTGETGAGKSIIIDAVETLLGGRAEAIQVRSGAERASVEGIFRIPANTHQQIQAILEREDLLDEPDFLTLAREVRLNGRNVARVNGRSVNTALLRELGEYLVDVHGQSEHLSLLRVNQHQGLLDRYASSEPQNKLPEVLSTYTQAYQLLHDIQHELNEIRQAERDAARRVDMLTFQIKEIESAHLQTGEEETLREERNRLANAESLASLAQQAVLALDEGTPESPAATDLLGQISQALAALTRLDPSQNSLDEAARSIFESLTDLTRNVRLYQDNIEFNPKRLDQVEERLALIQSLKRKYGETLSVVLEFAVNARSQLEKITHAGERLEELEKKRGELLLSLGSAGIELSQLRHSAATHMEKAIEIELADLNMSGARFKVDFQQQPDVLGVALPDGNRVAYYPTGLERTEFLIAPNPGEGFKPLTKIASGGETSRLMLALKNVLAKADHIPTLIFDEIDQGIGGRVGGIVGQKLRQLGRQHQVLCITHLPQLAAYGEQHFHVEKQVQSGRTLTQLKKLDGEARLVELAQMLGGLSDGTLQSARELLQTAQTQAPLAEV